MKYFTCDACHYIFQSDDIPSFCPACNASSIVAQNDSNRKFKIPAVRGSTETEVEQSKLADTERAAEKSFLERVKGLSDYTLTDDEYHTALMLLFYFRSTPNKFTAGYLNDLLYGRNSFIESKAAETSARNLYIQAQKHFASELGRERRETGSNDAVEVASYTEKNSAANMLLLFRQNETDQILCKTQNLTNIRNVKFDQVVKKPGKDYIHFLMDWYNSVNH
ncbi:MAG: hypothetical protein K2N89_14605 [Lachnospiraceae bacterium]|nr:hypothetical protein [Lachnospiraceae bacterium]